MSDQLTAHQYHEATDKNFDRFTFGGAPTQTKAFVGLNAVAFSPESKVLSPATRELIATACALVTQCVYCLESHAKGAKAAQVPESHVAETIILVAQVKAASVFTQGEPEDEVLGGDLPTALQAFVAAGEEDQLTLPALDRSLIRFATATMLGNAQQASSFRTAAANAGASQEQLSNVLSLCALMNASAAMAHGRLVWKFYSA